MATVDTRDGDTVDTLDAEGFEDVPKVIGRGRMLLSRAVDHSLNGDPVYVARRLDQALLVLEGAVPTELWYRVACAKHLACRGDDIAARAELRLAMLAIDSAIAKALSRRGAE